MVEPNAPYLHLDAHDEDAPELHMEEPGYIPARRRSGCPFTRSRSSTARTSLTLTHFGGHGFRWSGTERSCEFGWGALVEHGLMSLAPFRRAVPRGVVEVSRTLGFAGRG